MTITLGIFYHTGMMAALRQVSAFGTVCCVAGRARRGYGLFPIERKRFRPAQRLAR